MSKNTKLGVMYIIADVTGTVCKIGMTSKRNIGDELTRMKQVCKANILHTMDISTAITFEFDDVKSALLQEAHFHKHYII